MILSRCRSTPISIHALREEGDPYEYRIFHTKLVFLSTPSARRATSASGCPATGQKISIHALREEGDQLRRSAPASSVISIHALREEGDRSRSSPKMGQGHFYPRPPRGGRRHPRWVM